MLRASLSNRYRQYIRPYARELARYSTREDGQVQDLERIGLQDVHSSPIGHVKKRKGLETRMFYMSLQLGFNA